MVVIPRFLSLISSIIRRLNGVMTCSCIEVKEGELIMAEWKRERPCVRRATRRRVVYGKRLICQAV